MNKKDERYHFSDACTVLWEVTDTAVYLTSLSYIRIARCRDGRNFTINDLLCIYPEIEREA